MRPWAPAGRSRPFQLSGGENFTFTLRGGENSTFTLRVVDLVGQESATSTHTVTRLTTPAPVVTIAAPTPTLVLGAGELLLLQAKAQLVSCNGAEKGRCSGRVA